MSKILVLISVLVAALLTTPSTAYAEDLYVDPSDFAPGCSATIRGYNVTVTYKNNNFSNKTEGDIAGDMKIGFGLHLAIGQGSDVPDTIDWQSDIVSHSYDLSTKTYTVDIDLSGYSQDISFMDSLKSDQPAITCASEGQSGRATVNTQYQPGQSASNHHDTACFTPESSEFNTSICHGLRGAAIYAGQCYKFRNPDQKNDCQKEQKCKNSADKERCLAKLNCDGNKGQVFTTFFGQGDDRCVTPDSLIPALINFILTISSLIAAGVFIWGGFKYLTSKGDPGALADARDMIMQAVIGIIVIALSFAIANYLSGAFGSLGKDQSGQPSIDFSPMSGQGDSK